MSGRFGIGLVIEGEAQVTIIRLQEAIASRTGNDYGLKQPPHITLKRPFTVATDVQLSNAIRLLDELARKLSTMKIRFTKIGTFPNHTVYLVPDSSSNRKLRSAYEDIAAAYIHFGDPYPKPIFHCTLAHQLSNVEFDSALQEFEQYEFNDIHTTCTQLVLLREHENSWIPHHYSNLVAHK